MQECELQKNGFSDAGNIGFEIQEHIDLSITYGQVSALQT